MSRPLDVPTHVSYRYLLVELPIDPSKDDPDNAHWRMRADVAYWLSYEGADSAFVDVPTVSVVYPGDVVPGGESDD